MRVLVVHEGLDGPPADEIRGVVFKIVLIRIEFFQCLLYIKNILRVKEALDYFSGFVNSAYVGQNHIYSIW